VCNGQRHARDTDLTRGAPRQSSWLRRLARGLVAGEGEADDLVQETWLVALRHPPRAGGSPRPWLARVARRLASNFRRSRARRTAHEEGAVRAERLLDPSATTEALEIQRILAEAVLRLEEPLRSTVVLRYLRELDSNQIGELQGTPPGTVRWRLKRALELLREDLDSRLSDDERRWSSALAAWLGARASTATKTTTMRRTLASAKAVAGAVLGLTGFVGVLVLLRGEERSRGASVARAEPVELSREHESELVQAEALAPELPEPASAVDAGRTLVPRSGPPAPRRRAPIRGRLRIGRSDEPLDEVLALHVRTGDLSIREEITTAPDGSFTTTRDFPRGFVLVTVLYPSGEVADEQETAFDPASSAEWNVPVRWPTFLRLRVVDRDGSPLRKVSLSFAKDDAMGKELAGSSSNGAERFDGLSPSSYTLILRSGFAHALVHVRIGRGPNDLGDVVLAHDGKVGTIHGELRASDDGHVGAVMLTDLDGALVALAQTTDQRSGETEFVLEDVPAGDYRLVPFSYDGRRFAPGSVRVSPPADDVVFDVVGKREVFEIEWPADTDRTQILARVRGRWLIAGMGLPLAEVERWAALALDRRPVVGEPPKTGALTPRFEAGWGHAYLFVEPGGALIPGFGDQVGGRPLPGAEVVVDGRVAASSDDAGLALVSLAHAPASVEFRASGWALHSLREEDTFVTVVVLRPD